MYVGLQYLTIIFITTSWNMSKFFTNTGQIERAEKTAITSVKRKLQFFFFKPEEDKSLILGYGGGVVRGDGGDNDDGDDDDKATYVAVYFYNKCMRKHTF